MARRRADDALRGATLPGSQYLPEQGRHAERGAPRPPPTPSLMDAPPCPATPTSPRYTLYKLCGHSPPLTHTYSNVLRWTTSSTSTSCWPTCTRPPTRRCSTTSACSTCTRRDGSLSSKCASSIASRHPPQPRPQPRPQPQPQPPTPEPTPAPSLSPPAPSLSPDPPPPLLQVNYFFRPVIERLHEMKYYEAEQAPSRRRMDRGREEWIHRLAHALRSDTTQYYALPYRSPYFSPSPLSLSLPWQELPSREREKEREREKQKLLEDVVDEIFDMVKPKPNPNPNPNLTLNLAPTLTLTPTPTLTLPRSSPRSARPSRSRTSSTARWARPSWASSRTSSPSCSTTSASSSCTPPRSDNREEPRQRDPESLGGVRTYISRASVPCVCECTVRVRVGPRAARS